MTAFVTSIESVVEIILVIALGFYLRKKINSMINLKLVFLF